MNSYIKAILFFIFTVSCFNIFNVKAAEPKNTTTSGIKNHSISATLDSKLLPSVDGIGTIGDFGSPVALNGDLALIGGTRCG